MDVDMNELEKLAKAATPGLWAYSPERDTHDFAIHAADAELGNRHSSGSAKGGVVGSSEWIWLKEEDGRFIAAANPQTVLALIQMVRSAYSRALRDVREAMRVAQAEGRAPACGCDSHGFEPGCMVHDPTAVPLGREG